MVERRRIHRWRVAYQQRNRDLDPQLVWRGKDEQDLDALMVNAPPRYIQEKVHPKVLIDDMVRHARNGREPADHQIDVFADLNGLRLALGALYPVWSPPPPARPPPETWMGVALISVVMDRPSYLDDHLLGPAAYCG